MLASPIIEGTIPAFYLDKSLDDGNGAALIAVPFTMSKAVHQNEVQKFSLKIKNLQESNYLLSLESNKIDFINNIAYFSIKKRTLEEKNFIEGMFYKIQLAYVDFANITGYYSTVGVIKYTTKPNIYINNLDKYNVNSNIYNYTGIYSQKDKDTSEKEYSYRFLLIDDQNNIIEDTGYLIHNSENDTNYYESSDVLEFNKDLEYGKRYYIKYFVNTNNGLEVSSQRYEIQQKKSVESTLDINKINVILNSDNGYIKINMIGNIDPITKNEKLGQGTFILSRSSEKTNFMEWEIINKFSLIFEKPSSKEWKDFTVEQGIRYKYSIQQTNNKDLYSERIISDEILVDFEDAFLYDGKRQLKIKFNPKVSSFKKNLLEQKIETIGSKYPFIFKNGYVEYKEFPISGLISYQMDEENLFLNTDNNKEENYRPNKNYYNTSIYSQQYPGSISYIQIKNPTFEQLINNDNIWKNKCKLFYVYYENKYITLYDYFNRLFKYSEIYNPLSLNDIKLFLNKNPKYNIHSKLYVQKNNIYFKTKTPTFKNLLESEKNYKKNCHYYYIYNSNIKAYQSLYDYFNSLSSFINNDYKAESAESVRNYLELYDYNQPPNILYVMKNENYDNTYIEENNFNNLTTNHITKERDFKLEVLDWLTNGEVKLFRSPTEGNYLIRLLNVSLTPNDTLGRMLHTFNATAYEVADITYDNLIKYNLLDLYTNSSYLKIKTIPLYTQDSNYKNLSKIKYVWDEKCGGYFATGELLVNNSNILSAVLDDMTPGDEIIIDGSHIQIPSSGHYEIPFEVSSIKLSDNAKSFGMLTIQYETNISDSFNEIQSVSNREVLGKQIIGETANVMDLITNKYEKKVSSFYNIIFNRRKIVGSKNNKEEIYYVESTFEPVDRYTINRDNYLNYYYRDPDNLDAGIQQIWWQTDYYDERYEYFESCNFVYNNNNKIFKLNINNITNSIDIEESYIYVNKLNLYQFNFNNDDYIYDPYIDSIIKIDEEYFNNFYNILITTKTGDNMNLSLINNNSIQTGVIDNIQSISIGNGIYIELFYQEQRINYDISDNFDLLRAKEKIDEYDKIMMNSDKYKNLEDIKNNIEQKEFAFQNYNNDYDYYYNLLSSYLDLKMKEG